MSATPTPERVRVRTPGKHIVLFVAAALAVAGAGLNFMNSADAPSARPPRIVAGKTQRLPLDAFLVDLAPDRSGRTAYLKLEAVVEFASSDTAGAARMQQETAAVRERLSFLLRGLTPDDFAGADGMARVKTEMLRRVNLVIAPEKAADVVITDLVIQ
jgi:flagellar basal body-associated protein FliL